MTRTLRSWVSCSLAALACAGIAGCGSAAVPRELADARTAYGQAQTSPAASLTPADLLDARQALDRAEKAFENDPEAQETRDLAYVAQRRAQRAQALGSIAYATRQIGQAQRDFVAAQGQLQQRTEAQLQQTRQEAQSDKQQMSQQLATGREQLAAERAARVEAERRAKEAMANLARVASVKEEARGTVISLSGAVLFASAQSSLLPIAQDKLNQVADALKENPNQTILIEGHTDSRGSATVNDALSLQRAQAVRDYLISRGIPAERVRAVGIGSARSIADNATPEGRANNRRVEIIVEPAKDQGKQGQSTSPYE